MMRSWRAGLCCAVLTVACGREASAPGSELTDMQPVSADGGTDDADASLHPLACRSDEDCLDGRFCNGDERCLPSAADADARGCLAGTSPCDTGSSCDEAHAGCVLCSDDDDLDDDSVAGVACGGLDCADDDPKRFPGNPELCDDGHDEDCDLSTVGARDLDNDQFVDAFCTNTGGSAGDDCNDANAGIHPHLNETCNGLNDNCADGPDEGLLGTFYEDLDGDEHGDRLPSGESANTVQACGNAPTLADTLSDCDPLRVDVHELQVEFCDGLDNDCDGEADDSAGAVIWYRDADGDGFGDPNAPTKFSCFAPGDDWAIIARDCDDSDPDVSPVAAERCDGKDNNCNGRADYRIAPGDYEDDDGDGHVDAACTGLGDDCNDADYTTYAGAPELCDRRDNDCNGNVDDDTKPLPWFRDEDGDGFGDEGDPEVSCKLVTGRVLRGGDCADHDASVNPGAADDCSGKPQVDDDCDGLDDDEVLPVAWYVDLDGDGFGSGVPSVACTAGVGYADYGGDCDEASALRHPGASEACGDRLDNDCDGLSDCDDSDCFDQAGCAEVSELELLGGAEQTIEIGRLFAERLQVRLRDESGASLAGKSVTLTALVGSGADPSLERLTTDAGGLVSFELRAGRKVGTDLLRVTAQGARPLTVRVHVIAPDVGEIVSLLNANKELGDGALGRLASWAEPDALSSVVASEDGTLYFGTASRIYRLTVTGTLEHVAGDASAPFADGVDARRSAIEPRGLALDERVPGDSRLYVADPAHARIRVIELSSGRVSTLAGGGSARAPDYGDGQAATSARLGEPAQLVLIGSALYFTDDWTLRLRKVDLDTGLIDGVQLSASPDLTVCACLHGCSIAQGPSGQLFMAARAVGKRVEDTGPCSDVATPAIVRIDGSLTPHHVAGTRAGNPLGDVAQAAMGTALPADIASIAFDPAGNLYFVAHDHRLRRLDATTWRIESVLGDGTGGTTGEYGQGVARIDAPHTLLFVGRHLLMAEPSAATLRLVWSLGKSEPTVLQPVLTSAAQASATILSAAAPLSVQLSTGDGAALEGALVQFRSVNPASYLSSTRALSAADGSASSTPWLGRALKSYAFEAVFEDIHGRPYHAPVSVQRAAVAPAPGTVLPLVNGGRLSVGEEVPGPGLRAGITNPTSLAVASDGTVYVASGADNRVYSLSPDGHLDVLAGTGWAGNEGDGGPARSAQLTTPFALALDEVRARLYVGQYEFEQSASPKSRIRVIELGAEPMIDGWVTGLNRIQGLSVSAEGTLYVAKESESLDDGFRAIDPETRETHVFLQGSMYEANQVRFYYCYAECGVVAESMGNVIVAGSFGGDPYWQPRSPPYGFGIARFAPAQGQSLERLVGRGVWPLTCPDHCDGGEGSALDLTISPARSLALHGSDLYFVERGVNRIRLVRNGQMTTIMGAGGEAQDYVPARDAALAEPAAIAVTSDGHVIVADTGNNEVRLIW